MSFQRVLGSTSDFFRFFLFPFTILHGLITTARNYFYDVGVFTSYSFDVPIIVVGNLSIGGTGKTPMIEHLIRILQKNNQVAVLSRGYKRKTTGFILLNSSHEVEDVGDEPLQFFRKFSKISVAVDEDRVNGIQELQKDKRFGVVLLDDAYQHRRVKAACYILLTTFDNLYSDDFIFPTGTLREGSRGARRAQIIVVTKCPRNLSFREQEEIKKKLNPRTDQEVFFSSINYHYKTKGEQQISIDQLSKYEILLVTGIANPAPMLEFLNQRKCRIDHMKFSDHHHFTSQEVNAIKARYEAVKSHKKVLLTTEKDFMRLSKKISFLSYLEMSSVFGENAIEFENKIKSFCKTDF